MTARRLRALAFAAAGSVALLALLYWRTGRMGFGAIEIWVFATAVMVLAAFHFTKPPRGGSGDGT